MRRRRLAVRRVEGEHLAVHALVAEEAVGLAQPLRVELGLHLENIVAAPTALWNLACDVRGLREDPFPLVLVDGVPCVTIT